ncbi:MAG: xanthan lyase, partial [Tannerella sp.]|nr:xanthan lyase [Tannerella sp.]
MALLSNINSVAKYESKLLMRSWFYRIFLILAILTLCFINLAFLVIQDNNQFWIMRALPSNIPYLNLLILNTGQAVIAVFLSSEFLKSDKKLDTSEVFYVHPLSNAEYVIGKIWGNMGVFLRLDLILIGLVIIFNLVSGIKIDWISYVTYFLIICIPTLIYIFGLSVGLMLILKNQAITFVLLLGYIALTLFYIADKYYYLFDYMVYNLPLVKSSLVGFTNWSVLVNHRLIYLLIGMGFLCISIFLFRRLPNTKYGRYRWLALSFVFIIGGIIAGYRHVDNIINTSDKRAMYVDINNKYVGSPQMAILKYDISVEQQPASISATVVMTGTASESSAVFTFCLNPFLQVSEIKAYGESLKFTRDHQIMLVDFGRVLEAGDTTTLSVTYQGAIDEDFCYLDIPDELMQEKFSSENIFSIDKKYSFQTENYVLFTPETYWYP